MSEAIDVSRQRSPIPRLLTTFKISDEILMKLKSKGFRLKSEIECLSDSILQSICDLSEQQIEEINRVIRNSHKKTINCINVSDIIDEYIHTGSYSLDRSMNGGLQVSKITQISAEGGAGKTQICMQCCVNVQMPPKYGGLSGQALYIDTENNFRPERVNAMAKHRLSTHPDLLDSLSVSMIESQIFTFKCITNSDHLIDLVINKIEPFIDTKPGIRLIVIDSIAQLFRFDYRADNNRKDYELTLIANKLKFIAHTKKVAVLIANQMTYNPLLDKSVPSLGKHWQNSLNLSVIFKKYDFTQDLIRIGRLLRSNQTQLDLRFYFKITKNGIEEGVPGDRWHPHY